MNKLYIAIFFLFYGFLASGQSLKDLQNQKKSADIEIARINEQLNETKKEKTTTIKQVTLVHSMIQKRKKIIENIDHQVVIFSKNIAEKSDNIVKLRKEIDTLKLQYANTLRQAYKLRNSTSAIALVLASSDLQQAIMRMKYLRSYSDYRMEQANKIEKEQQQLKNEIADLNQKKKSLEVLLADKNKEVKRLDNDEKTYKSMVDQLKSKEKDLLKEIQKRRLLSERLNREINFLIAEEARKAQEAARKRAAEEAARNKKLAADKAVSSKTSSSKTVTKELPFTPEDKIVAGKFEANRGRLPWPVRQGEVVETFGEHLHPFLKGIRIKNDGVNIAAPTGSEIMSVYDGEVSKVFTLPGANISVLIRHGYYITVYSNLARVSVKEGQNVKAKQVIGIIANSETGSDKPLLQFQIRKETTPLNPELWLSR